MQIADPMSVSGGSQADGPVLDEMVNEELIVQAAECVEDRGPGEPEVRPRSMRSSPTTTWTRRPGSSVLAAQAGYTTGQRLSACQLLRMRAVNQLVALTGLRDRRGPPGPLQPG